MSRTSRSLYLLPMLVSSIIWNPDIRVVVSCPDFSDDDVPNLSGSIAEFLCDEIFTNPIHWAQAPDFPETATHAIDFGPSGLNGIGT